MSNAGSRYTSFRRNLAHLGDIDWAAVHSRDFRDRQVKERKQAEFLVQGSFPWGLVTRIGVREPEMAVRVTEALESAQHQPIVQVRPTWYYG